MHYYTKHNYIIDTKVVMEQGYSSRCSASLMCHWNYDPINGSAALRCFKNLNPASYFYIVKDCSDIPGTHLPSPLPAYHPLFPHWKWRQGSELAWSQKVASLYSYQVALFPCRVGRVRGLDFIRDAFSHIGSWMCDEEPGMSVRVVVVLCVVGTGRKHLQLFQWEWGCSARQPRYSERAY